MVAQNSDSVNGSSQQSPPSSGSDLTAQAGSANLPSGARELTPEEAVKFLTEKVEQGDTVAMLDLARLYQNGIGVRANHTKATELFQKAAEKGDPLGYFFLGQAYEIGLGLKADEDKAWENYQKAAELDSPEGLYRMAITYLEGSFGQTPDEKKAFEFLKKSCDKNYAPAANHMGQVYMEGTLGQTRNHDTALKYYTKSAELGNSEAMKNIAVIYHQGLGRPINEVEAYKWFRLAQAAGFPNQDWPAIFNSLRKNLSDEEVKKADSEAMAWADKFNKQGRENTAQP
jgi:TPR repeat protein